MKAKRPNCANYNRCGRRARGPYARFCMSCFKANAAFKGSASSGNSRGNPGNAGNSRGSPGNAGNASGSPGNAGNANAGGSLGNAGNASAGGSPGNAENASAGGSPRNAGNAKRGKVKKSAGKRSGVRRSAKRALVVKKKWLDLVLEGRKTLEIRGSSTTKRGWIHFAESQAGGKLLGRARLVNCIPVPKKSFKHHSKEHHVSDLREVPYDTLYAWVLEDAEKFGKPFEYVHKQGAVIWDDV